MHWKRQQSSIIPLIGYHTDFVRLTGDAELCTLYHMGTYTYECLPCDGAHYQNNIWIDFNDFQRWNPIFPFLFLSIPLFLVWWPASQPKYSINSKVNMCGGSCGRLKQSLHNWLTCRFGSKLWNFINLCDFSILSSANDVSSRTFFSAPHKYVMNVISNVPLDILRSNRDTERESTQSISELKLQTKQKQNGKMKNRAEECHGMRRLNVCWKSLIPDTFAFSPFPLFPFGVVKSISKVQNTELHSSIHRISYFFRWKGEMFYSMFDTAPQIAANLLNTFFRRLNFYAVTTATFGKKKCGRTFTYSFVPRLVGPWK